MHMIKCQVLQLHDSISRPLTISFFRPYFFSFILITSALFSSRLIRRHFRQIFISSSLIISRRINEVNGLRIRNEMEHKNIFCLFMFIYPTIDNIQALIQVGEREFFEPMFRDRSSSINGWFIQGISKII